MTRRSAEPQRQGVEFLMVGLQWVAVYGVFCRIDSGLGLKPRLTKRSGGLMFVVDRQGGARTFMVALFGFRGVWRGGGVTREVRGADGCSQTMVCRGVSGPGVPGGVGTWKRRQPWTNEKRLRMSSCGVWTSSVVGVQPVPGKGWGNGTEACGSGPGHPQWELRR